MTRNTTEEEHVISFVAKEVIIMNVDEREMIGEDQEERTGLIEEEIKDPGGIKGEEEIIETLNEDGEIVLVDIMK